MVMPPTYRVYELAKQPSSLGSASIGVDLVTEPVFHPLYVWREDGANTHGAQCSVEELLTSWREHLELCGARWLVPVLEHFATDEAFDKDVVLQAYREHHGHTTPFRDIERKTGQSTTIREGDE